MVPRAFAKARGGGIKTYLPVCLSVRLSLNHKKTVYLAHIYGAPFYYLLAKCDII